MKNSKLNWITRTAMLVALIVVAQLLTRVIPPIVVGPLQLNQLVTGSLVNLILIVGAFAAGLPAAATAAIISPILAAFFGIIPGQLPQMIPVVMAGNFTIVFVTWLCFRASNGLDKGGSTIINLIGILSGALLKSAVMWSATVKIVVPVFKIAAKKAQVVTGLVTLPQFVTAVIGGIIALLVLPAMKSFKKARR
jgi:hypothetical protein